MLFQFGSDYATSFGMVNKRAQKRRERQGQERRPIAPSQTPRLPMARPEARPLKSPKSISEADKKVIMGELNRV